MLYRTKEEYQQYVYTKDLRKTANGLGIVLLVIFAMEIILAMVITLTMHAAGFDVVSEANGDFGLLENGLLSCIMFFAVTLIYALIKKRSFGAMVPFEKIGVKKLSMLCVIGTALALMCNLAPDLLTDVFGLFGLTNRGGTFVFDDSVPTVLMYYLTVAILPACVEEFAFRGVIMGSLRKYSDALALVVSAAVFALMHGNFVQMPFTFCCGLVFGFLVMKTNSLLPAILVHFFNNALSVTFDLLYQYQVISSETVTLIYGIIVVVLCALALVFIRRFINEEEGYFRLKGADEGIPYREKLKTVAGSPTLISYAVIMLLFSIYVLIQPYLI